jgi:uncharacterized protein
MAAVRITDAPLTIEDSLAVANGAQVELAEGVRAKIADGPAVMDPGPGCRERRPRPHGPGRPRQRHQAGNRIPRLAEPSLIYGGNVYYLLLYDLVDQFAERRPPYRDAHLKLARAAADNGELLLGGAFADPVDGAALVFKAADQSVAERFAANDPYVTAGLVTKWTARKWTVVIEALP